MMLLASTLGTSWGNLTSHYDTTDAITTVSLSDGTDVGKRGQRNFYDGRVTGSPVKNTLFDDMRRKLKSNAKVKEPRPVKKKPQSRTAQNKLKQLCQKLKQCKMGRKAWLALILVLSVIYPFLMSLLSAMVSWSEYTIAQIFAFSPGTSGAFILIAIIYLCVLLCFWCSKKGKCIVNRICKDETRTETKNNEGEVNKKQEALKEPGTFQKQEGPTKKEAPGTAGESEKLEAPKKTEVPKTPDAPKEAEAPKKTELPEKQGASAKLDAPKKQEAPKKPESPKKQETPKKPETPKKQEAAEKQKAPGKLKLPWSLKLPKKP
ncbi:hypothetical protein AK88_05541 [Plasmodium fragile]|uniref:Uncharacterized protein n=1 Tax=Plasmodium fragile TaxID=5857 RepID=A0A0D9QCX5_PLAFR|nr:uncharacterized protein AK88_05541 [Plasmodium fragile]KJP84829.1 hypothetical protein AK88_05541 [Plasmodium fragile]